MHRRPELDWLRVVAIVILHAFHVGMMFNRWDFHLKNPDPLPILEPPMGFLHAIRMPLLMVIAGIGTAIALERRSVGALAVDRTKRLLLPLVFGMFVVVPPQIYIEWITKAGYPGSYLDFYPSVLALRPYPAGSFSWHHLWFVAYLFLYCMAALPMFAGLATRRGRRLLGWLDRAWARGWLAALLVPLAIERIALHGYPETHALINDPNTLAYYGLLFVLGHLLGRSRTAWDHLVARRGRYLAATCAVLAVMLPPNEYPMPFEQLGTAAAVWLVILTAFAWTRWYFQRPGARIPSWLAHAQALSYPFYILHQTVILIVGWAWLHVALGPWPRFAAVLVTSFAATWLVSELVARLPPLRPLFGLAPRRSPGTAVAPALARVA
jgi:peptidoglycan/LPS O-acetylase OafA/YrhL